MRISGALFAALLGVLSSTAFAGNDGERFTSYAGFQLGVGTLDDVQHRLGAADAVHSGDGGESGTRICYRVPDGVISFLAGEIGGESELTGFSISTAPRRECASWPSGRPIPAMSVSGLRPGMTKQQFESMVGVQVDWQKDGNGYAFFESRRKPTQEELALLPADIRGDAMYDVSVTVTGSFAHGKLAEIEVWKVETY